MATRKITKGDCSGCRDNFYNGHNELGVKECWCFKDAKMEKRLLIPIHLPPPYNAKEARLMPNCYRGQGYVAVKPDALDSRGFWRR